MRYLLAPPCRGVLKRLAAEETLCAFDFDGTLAPIVEHPDQAGLRRETTALLKEVATAYPCVILSGRAGDDLVPRLRGIPLKSVIGNHGAESEPATHDADEVVRGWKTAVSREVAAMPGTWIEDKGLSLAVHYRQAAQKAEAQRRILAAVQGLERARIFGGKHVVNVVFEGAPHKGDALAAERERQGCKWVLYVGDDENDEDAFMLEGNTVSVRVGRMRGSGARYYLRNQAEIDILLRLLAEFRSGQNQACA